MKSILGIDPGSSKSAFVLWNNKTIPEKGILPNEQMLDFLDAMWREPVTLAIESMNHITKGGKAIIDTLLWAGQFYHAWQGEKALVERYKVTLALTKKNPSKESDKLVRASLIARFGPPGTKKNPNPITYGLHTHLYSALAVAVVWMDHLEFQGRELK